jgi:hypothetical protein
VAVVATGVVALWCAVAPQPAMPAARIVVRDAWRSRRLRNRAGDIILTYLIEIIKNFLGAQASGGKENRFD